MVVCFLKKLKFKFSSKYLSMEYRTPWIRYQPHFQQLWIPFFLEITTDFIFLGSKISLDTEFCHETYDKPRQRIKKQTSLCWQSYFFSSSHLWRWELGHKEGWAQKKWFFQTVVLEKTLKSPLDNKEIKPVNPKGNQPWILIGRTDAEAEAPILLATWCKELTQWKRPWC